MIKRAGALLGRIGRAQDARNAGLLIAATIVAQIILLATMPILTRLYDPAAWGRLGVLTSIGTVAGAIGALCYDVAIMVPRSPRAARALFALSIRLSFLTACVVAALIALAGWVAPRALGGPADALFVLAGAATGWATTLANAFGHALGRVQRYRPIAAAKVTQTLFPAGAQIACAALGPAGLLAGRGLGMAASAGLYARALPPGYRLADVFRARWRDLAAVSRSYKDFLVHVPRQILVRGASALPAVLMVASFGAAVGGFFFVAQRLVERPGALLGDALSRLPMRRFARLRAERRPLLGQALLYTALIAAPLLAGVALIAWAAEPLIAFLFGAAWADAAGYVAATAVWAGVRMASLPITTLITVLRVQKASLAIDSAFSPRPFVIPILAGLGHAPLPALWGFIILSVVYHGVVVALGVWAARRHDAALAPGAGAPPQGDPA
jgi:O-antigen/teichoic acid export membrane protein